MRKQLTAIQKLYRPSRQSQLSRPFRPSRPSRPSQPSRPFGRRVRGIHLCQHHRAAPACFAWARLTRSKGKARIRGRGLVGQARGFLPACRTALQGVPTCPCGAAVPTVPAVPAVPAVPQTAAGLNINSRAWVGLPLAIRRAKLRPCPPRWVQHFTALLLCATKFSCPLCGCTVWVFLSGPMHCNTTP